MPSVQNIGINNLRKRKGKKEIIPFKLIRVYQALYHFLVLVVLLTSEIALAGM